KRGVEIGGAIDDHGVALEVVVHAGDQQLREENRAARVDTHARIGGETPGGALLVRQRLVGAEPTGSAIEREIGALWIAEDLVGGAGEDPRGDGVHGNKRLALRTGLVADVYVGTYVDAGCAAVPAGLLGQQLIHPAWLGIRSRLVRPAGHQRD